MDEYTIRVSGRLSDALLSAFPTLARADAADPDRVAGASCRISLRCKGF